MALMGWAELMPFFWLMEVRHTTAPPHDRVLSSTEQATRCRPTGLAKQSQILGFKSTDRMGMPV